LSSPSPARARLLELLKRLSWQRGRVVLSSGKTSDFYIDCKQTALNAEGSALVGELVFEHAQALRQQGLRIDGVGGITLGADPIAAAAAVVSFQRGAPMHAFIIRKEPKGHGTGQWIEGRRTLPDGSRVVIIEDVVTTGKSALQAIERCRQEQLGPVACVALVDRQEGGREAIEASGVPLQALFTRGDFIA
jgi:orotate phosphoribosyltransferase